MLGIIFNCFIYLLAGYGILSLIINIINSISLRLNYESENIRLVLIVKNQQEAIEGVVRNIFSGDYLRRVMSGKNLAVLDLGSTDETPRLLEKLKRQYEYIDVYTLSEKEKLFEGSEEAEFAETKVK